MPTHHFTTPETPAFPPVAVRHLATELATRFGGYTVWTATGGWHDGAAIIEEPVRVWRVTVEDERGTNDLRRLVRNALRAAGEKAAYFDDEVIDLRI